MTGQPARSPLPRSAQPHAAEPDVHHITVQRRRRTILGEQRDLPGVLATLVKCFDGPAPRRSLAIVDLAQIQHVPLHRSTAANPAVLYDAPVAMFLTVLAADLVAQKHAARLSQLCAVSQATWSAPQTVAANHRAADPRFSVTYLRGGARKSLESRVSSESRVSVLPDILEGLVKQGLRREVLPVLGIDEVSGERVAVVEILLPAWRQSRFDPVLHTPRQSGRLHLIHGIFGPTVREFRAVGDPATRALRIRDRTAGWPDAEVKSRRQSSSRR